MKQKFSLLFKSLKLVRSSAPGWATANVFLSLLRSILPLLLLWLIKLLIDKITGASGSGQFTSEIIVLIILTASVYLIDEISADLSNMVRKNQSVKLESYMYDLLHRKSVQLDLINFERPEYFDILSRASAEAPWRPNSILNNVISLIRGLASLLLMTGLILTLNWILALVLLVVNIPGVILRLRYSDELYSFRRKQTPEARKSAYFNWLLTGDRPSRELRLFGLGEYFRELFRKSFRKQKEEELEIIRKRSFIEMISALFKAAAMLFVLIFIAERTVTGKISLGEMAMFLLAFRQGMTYIKDVLASVSGLYEDSLFTGDVFTFLSLEEKIRAEEPLVSVPGDPGRITLKEVSFTYPGNNDKTIDKVSLDIGKGEVIALVGPNGAGKSTLIRLLCRLYDPDSGSVEIDGKGIRHFDPAGYRKLFSVIFQDFMLYNLTAGENIRLGDTGRDESSAVSRAARSAGIDGVLSSLPEGYDTVIGNLFNDSRELSWGEWQKIALARSLYRDAPVLVLDEPSSAMDADTEYEIFSRFRELVKGRTVILISHRFTNVTLADRIIVMDRGRIAESGTHQSLMSDRGMYYNMYTKQSSRFE
ncbi:MAG TPA: ABC transporter ATP-binding protein [Bacteroidales bacterium]|nr:ABC transporter ATP-binding protein [Bacteroidales bacterium]